jgi:hypothetical protein
MSYRRTRTVPAILIPAFEEDNPIGTVFKSPQNQSLIYAPYAHNTNNPEIFGQ